MENYEVLVEGLFAENSSDNESFYGFPDEELRGDVEESRNEDDVSIGEILGPEEDEEDLEHSDHDEEWRRPTEIGEWMEVLETVFIPPFTEETGPTVELGSGKKELDFFHELFTKDLYEKLAEETNRYAEQLQEERGVDNSWKPTNADEIQTFIGMRIYMSVVDLPELSIHWCEEKYFGNFGIADVMPRLRFEKLSQYLHANDRTAYNRGDTNRDKLHLIRPILDVVLANCLQEYHPHRDVAIDEAMVKLRGVLGFRQYMPAKPTKHWNKAWARADSSNGFVSEFEVYVEKPNGGGREIELRRKVVSKLTEKIKGKNHHVYFDNYFNGVKLMNYLGYVLTFRSLLRVFDEGKEEDVERGQMSK